MNEFLPVEILQRFISKETFGALVRVCKHYKNACTIYLSNNYLPILDLRRITHHVIKGKPISIELVKIIIGTEHYLHAKVHLLLSIPSRIERVGDFLIIKAANYNCTRSIYQLMEYLHLCCKNMILPSEQLINALQFVELLDENIYGTPNKFITKLYLVSRQEYKNVINEFLHLLTKHIKSSVFVCWCNYQPWMGGDHSISNMIEMIGSCIVISNLRKNCNVKRSTIDKLISIRGKLLDQYRLNTERYITNKSRISETS